MCMTREEAIAKIERYYDRRNQRSGGFYARVNFDGWPDAKIIHFANQLPSGKRKKAA